MKKAPFFILFCATTFIFSCSESVKDETNSKELAVSAEDFHNANIALENDIVRDFFSPPVASRIYVYPNLISYEIMSHKNDAFLSLQTILDDFPEIPEYEGELNDLAALYCFYLVAQDLVYTTKNTKSELDALKEKHQNHNEFKELESYCQKVHGIVSDWIKKDNYLQTRNMGDYVLIDTPGSWVPTPPDYMDALEPHWDKLRPLILDSANQFPAAAPTEFNMTKGSTFYNELMEVYDAVSNNTDSTVEIAKFWDCNPIVSMHEGHITYAEKKLTPGGHWMNIMRAAAKEQKADLDNTIWMYASLSIGIYDAFISCWHTKYQTNYIRPVTAIQNHIDPKWSAVLTTPNFPEYTSGHSVVSRSASTILTHIFGENYAFTDSTEVPFGMPPRTFTSFYHASDEAAISRFYGGIHYKPAIYKGVDQGKKVGSLVVQSIKQLKK